MLSHSQAKQFIRAQRKLGLDIEDVPLNRSTAVLNQVIQEFKSRQQRRLSLAKQSSNVSKSKALKRKAQEEAVLHVKSKRQHKRKLKTVLKKVHKSVYHLELRIHGLNWGANQGRLHGWAILDKTDVDEVHDYMANGIQLADIYLATGFSDKYPQLFQLVENIASLGPRIEVERFEEQPDHGIEAFNWYDVQLTDAQDPDYEPWIASEFARCGDIEWQTFRKESCLLNCIINEIKHSMGKKVMQYFEDPVLMYEIATGRKVEEGDPMPLTLKEAQPLFERFNFSCRAVDIKGVLVYRYDDKKTIDNKKAGRVVRLVVHDRHCTRVDPKLIKSFDNKYCNVEATPIVNVSNEIRISSCFKPLKKRAPAIAFVKTVKDVKNAMINYDGNDKRISLICENAEELAVSLMKKKIMPSDIFCRNGIASGFTIKFDGKFAGISQFIPCDEQLPPSITNLVQYNTMNDYMNLLQGKICKSSTKSSYSDGALKALQGFYRSPLCGTTWPDDVEPINSETDYVAFDISKCYCYHFMNMEHIPVFSKFDEFRPIPENHEIEYYSKYMIKVKYTDPILMNKNYDIVYGMTILEANKGQCELLGFMRPHKLEPLEGKHKTVIQQLYADKNLSESQKKFIVNSIIGISGKRYNRKQVAEITNTEVIGQYYRSFGESYLNVKKNEMELTEGYTPINELVLEANRIMINKMVSSLIVGRVCVMAIRTDCVYVYAYQEEKGIKALKEAGFEFANFKSTFDDIGKIRIETKKGIHLPQKLLRTKEIDPSKLPQVKPYPEAEHITMKTETYKSIDSAEYDDEFHECSAYMIFATVPGAGKTESVRLYLKRHPEKKGLVITSWNRLRCELMKKMPCPVITFAKLFGERPDNIEEEDHFATSYDVSGINHIHFDEIFLFSIKQFEKVKSFMASHPEITYSGCGDSFQLPAIGQSLNSSCNYDDYHKMILNELFPKQLTLHKSKRCLTEADAIKMHNLCDDLRNEMSIEKVIEKYKFPVINYRDMPEGSERCAHVSYTKATSKRVNNWAHPKITGREIDDFQNGDILLGSSEGNKKFSAQGKGMVYINSNSIYEILNMNHAKGVEMISGDDRIFYVSEADLNKSFNRPHSCTCHSSQGLTLGDELYIHDYGMGMHKDIPPSRWYFTAITRCSTMNIKFVKHY